MYCRGINLFIKANPNDEFDISVFRFASLPIVGEFWTYISLHLRADNPKSVPITAEAASRNGLRAPPLYLSLPITTSSLPDSASVFKYKF